MRGLARVARTQNLAPVFVAGVAETPLGKVLDQTELSMVALAADEALTEAGMTFKNVDAIFVHYMGEEGSTFISRMKGMFLGRRQHETF